jgi:hypothetical protein
VEEWGVTSCLQESLQATGEAFFTHLKSRGRANDPPDCEALDAGGKRIAIEVTELVDGRAIERYKSGRVYDWADWSREKFLSALSKRIADKGERYGKLKDSPYEGGYVVLVYTDEPMLPRETVKAFLDGQAFLCHHGVSRAFLLLSYEPKIGSYPYFDLTLTH